jgi:UMF1 family MFS transporter
MLGKFAAIVGPVLMGLTGSMAKKLLLLPPMPTEAQIIATGLTATRLSIVSVIVLFIAGGVLFYFVDEEKGKKQLEQLDSDALKAFATMGLTYGITPAAARSAS